MEVQKYQLDGVKGAVCTTQKVTIPPFQTINIKANAGVKGHCMKVHVLTEPVLGPQLPAAVVPIATYGEVHPGSSRVPVCLHNMSTHAMEIPAKTVVGLVIPANQVPLVVHPTRTAKETTTKAPKGWVLEALDLQGLKEWPESDQKKARELLLKWEHLFAHSNLDLCETALIKHKIRLTEHLLRRGIDAYLPICMMMCGPISKKCWILVLSINHIVCGQVQWCWFKKRMLT